MTTIPGICPKCGTNLDPEEIMFGRDSYEAYCVTCNKYIKKKIK